ncbi:D-alanine--D-alanine ligase [Insulibacter thermoxylanivorax]|uniref:D-alanine--D-alanine ligase n=1 Tax=Insulibacter thermoxylanivorax TaxID=2749268 RepID=A0A916QH86_9BACL|nr:D-alanine--D-alanine ligase [Insulibacter thermoxylanivorax]GFR39418.1 D-alanine--D-alanine ligase [Insulibacter thermoxylanivorax]
MAGKLRIGVVYGGRSGEHKVSLATAFSVLSNFDYDKYEIVPYYITKSGEWRKGDLMIGPPKSQQQLMLEGQRTLEDEQAVGKLLEYRHSREGVRSESGQAALTDLDVVFPLLHGTFGEDGTIQGLFEMAGIPYVGAGVLASAVALDKIVMKKLFAQEGLPQCIFRGFTRTDWERRQSYYILEIETALGYPCFVKPANLGSSVGISKVRNREELLEAVKLAFRYDRKVIVEEFVDAREIEVSVLGNDEPIASVPGEVVSSNEFYDYKAKYVDGKSAMIIPADLTPEQTEQVREMAIRAFKAIDGSGLCRADFFLRKSDGAILINEVNTMPGFTPYSMYPLLWKESGKSYRELLDDLIRLAIERYEERQKLDYGYEL